MPTGIRNWSDKTSLNRLTAHEIPDRLAVTVHNT